MVANKSYKAGEDKEKEIRQPNEPNRRKWGQKKQIDVNGGKYKLEGKASVQWIKKAQMAANKI